MIDLHAVGALDLAMFNPLLTAERAAGDRQDRARRRVGGTLSAPRINGTVRLANAAIEDFALGVHITDINGLHRSRRQDVQGDDLQGQGRARERSGSAALSILSAPGLPVNLQITARNARPLASDLLTATLNADLSLRGAAIGKLTVGGKIDVLHAADRHPEAHAGSGAGSRGSCRRRSPPRRHPRRRRRSGST